MKKRRFKYRKNDIIEVQLSKNSKIEKAVVVDAFYFINHAVYNVLFLQDMRFSQITKICIIRKIGRFTEKLKKCNTHNLYTFHFKIKIADEFINEYCDFYGDKKEDFIKELNDKNIYINDVLNAKITACEPYSKSYKIYLGDDYSAPIILPEKLILKFLL